MVWLITCFIVLIEGRHVFNLETWEMFFYLDVVFKYMLLMRFAYLISNIYLNSSLKLSNLIFQNLVFYTMWNIIINIKSGTCFFTFISLELVF